MYILHISDAHFGNNEDALNWHSQVTEDLRRNLRCDHLDAIIISGDIAHRSEPSEYFAAERFISLLLDEFSLRRSKIVIVPGNHDLNWSLSRDSYKISTRQEYRGSLDEDAIYRNNIIVDGNYIHSPEPDQYKQRFRNFSDFYERVTGQPYSQEYERQYQVFTFLDQGILILGLNSAWKLNHHENYHSRASINDSALSNALREINDIEQQYSEQYNFLKIGVWHHPIYSPYEDRITNHGFIERLANNGFRLALHGHIHRSGKDDYTYTLGQKVNIISAGTFGAEPQHWMPGHPLQYNLLKLDQKRILTVNTRRRIERGGAWTADAMWTNADGITASAYYRIDLAPPADIISAQELLANFRSQQEQIESWKILHEKFQIISLKLSSMRNQINVFWKTNDYKEIQYLINTLWAKYSNDLIENCDLEFICDDRVVQEIKYQEDFEQLKKKVDNAQEIVMRWRSNNDEDVNQGIRPFICRITDLEFTINSALAFVDGRLKDNLENIRMV